MADTMTLEDLLALGCAMTDDKIREHLARIDRWAEAAALKRQRFRPLRAYLSAAVTAAGLMGIGFAVSRLLECGTRAG